MSSATLTASAVPLPQARSPAQPPLSRTLSSDSFLSYVTVPSPILGNPSPNTASTAQPSSSPVGSSAPPSPDSARPSPPSQSTPQASPLSRRRSRSKRTAETLRIATLNMKGKGPSLPVPGSGAAVSGKWLAINQLMRERKLAVLAIQESHLSDLNVSDLHSLFGSRLLILHSAASDRPTANAGVAFVLNKERLETSQVHHHILYPGRAALLTVSWHKEVILSILNVYAPNAGPENEQFWIHLRSSLETGAFPKPDVILGDFNVVEDSADRRPPHPDHTGATQALSDFYAPLGLTDAWRQENPTDRLFTFVPEHGLSLSRLDRIYLSHPLARTATDWTASATAGIPSDHLLVSVSLTDHRIPFLGPGRWVIPKAVLSDFAFSRYVIAEGRALAAILPDRHARSPSHNAQTLWAKFKLTITQHARALAKTNIPKLTRRI
ncbi:DNase I-like protein, partial [Trametopsis cervina]